MNISICRPRRATYHDTISPHYVAVPHCLKSTLLAGKLAVDIRWMLERHVTAAIADTIILTLRNESPTI